MLNDRMNDRRGPQRPRPPMRYRARAVIEYVVRAHYCRQPCGVNGVRLRLGKQGADGGRKGEAGSKLGSRPNKDVNWASV